MGLLWYASGWELTYLRATLGFDPGWKIPCALGPLSSCTTASTQPRGPRARAQPQEKPHSPQLEQAAYSNRPCSPKETATPELPGSGAPCPFPDLRAPSRSRSLGWLPVLAGLHAVRAGLCTPSSRPAPCPRPCASLPRPSLLAASTFRNLVSVSPTLCPQLGFPHEQEQGHLHGPQPCPSI